MPTAPATRFTGASSHGPRMLEEMGWGIDNNRFDVVLIGANFLTHGVEPLLKKVQRKRLIRASAYRRRNELILRLLERYAHAAREITSVSPSSCTRLPSARISAAASAAIAARHGRSFSRAALERRRSPGGWFTLPELALRACVCIIVCRIDYDLGIIAARRNRNERTIGAIGGNRNWHARLSRIYDLCAFENRDVVRWRVCGRQMTRRIDHEIVRRQLI